MLILIACLVSIPAFGREATDAESESLKLVVEDFNAALKGSDYDRVIDLIPPKFLPFVASKSGIPLEELRKLMIAQMSSLMSSTKFDSFSMEMDALEQAQLEDGSPYFLIPTLSVIDLGDKGLLKSRTTTLAVLDKGRWYLARIENDEQVKILVGAYPAFAEVNFPEGISEVFDK